MLLAQFRLATDGAHRVQFFLCARTTVHMTMFPEAPDEPTIMRS